MKSDGMIFLNGNQIGTFVIQSDLILASIEKGPSLKETLEYAADNGLVISMQLTPEFVSED